MKKFKQALLLTTILLVVLTTECDCKISNCKTEADGVCTECNGNYFLSYRNPENSTDKTLMCRRCNCGMMSASCEDYFGCAECSGTGYYLLTDKPDYGSRSFKFCEKCDFWCENGSCVDGIGCSQCKTQHKKVKITNPFGRKWYTCKNTMGEDIQSRVWTIIILSFTLPICIVFCIICMIKRATSSVSKTIKTSTVPSLNASFVSGPSIRINNFGGNGGSGSNVNNVTNVTNVTNVNNVSNVNNVNNTNHMSSTDALFTGNSNQGYPNQPQPHYQQTPNNFAKHQNTNYPTGDGYSQF